MAEKFIVPRSLIDTYARDGAVLIPQPFGSHWIEPMIARVNEILAAHARGEPVECPVMRREGSVGIQNIILRDPLYRRWATESAAASIVGQVTRSKTVRFYFDNFFIKEGQGVENATLTHHDVPAFGFQGTQLPSFWLALTDVGEDNAPLVVWRGSQGDCTQKFRSPIQKPGLALLPGYREAREVQEYLRAGGYERQVMTAHKGDVIMVNPYCIHGSLARAAGAGPGLRIGFSSRWLGDDVRWHGSVYHEVEASTHPRPLVDGEPPPDEQFPVIWDRDRGQVCGQSGRFTTHVTLEPRKGYHTLAGTSPPGDSAARVESGRS